MHTYCNHDNNSTSLKSHSPRTIYSLTYSLRTTKSTNVLRLIATGIMYPKSFRCKSGAWKNLIFSDLMFLFLPTFIVMLVGCWKPSPNSLQLPRHCWGSWQRSKCPLSPSMSWRWRWCTSSPSPSAWTWPFSTLPRAIRKGRSWLDRWSSSEGRKIAWWGGEKSEKMWSGTFKFHLTKPSSTFISESVNYLSA